MTYTTPSNVVTDINRQIEIMKGAPLKRFEMPIIRVYEYQNPYNQEIAWALFTTEESDDIQSGASGVLHYVLLFDAKASGLTDAGKVFMEKASK